MKIASDLEFVPMCGTLPRGLNLPLPREIELERGLPRPTVGRFGKAEIEWAAGQLLNFIQSRGEQWQSFKLGDLFYYYKQQGWNPEEAFFGLSGLWFNDGMSTLAYCETEVYVICLGDSWAVTNLFVEACLKK